VARAVPAGRARRRAGAAAAPGDAVLADVASREQREQQNERGRREEDVPADARRALDDREQHRQGGEPEQEALVTAWHGP
jgi:hypothetical protein